MQVAVAVLEAHAKAVAGELSPERVSPDPEDAGCRGLDAVAGLEHGKHVLSLDLDERAER